jgi:hypothetical protein
MSDLIRSLQNKKASSSDADLRRVFQEGAKGVKHDGGPKDRYVRGTPESTEQKEIGKSQAYIRPMPYQNKKVPGPYIQKGPSRSGGPGQYIKSMGR